MPTPSPTHNIHEYSVSEISGALKRTVEDAFGHVRVRGEISGFTRAGSGHLYLSLKDERSVLNAVCWKGTAARLPFPPEDGLEVVCTGKLTTYGARSNYQLTIESMEIAGEGALMALLEKRRKQLAAEGLFDPARKKKLPFLPETIGVITSPTGAVIRDILHRLADRFPVHVIVWPVPVQGEGAAEQIAAAIEGLNNLDCAPMARGSGLAKSPDFAPRFPDSMEEESAGARPSPERGEAAAYCGGQEAGAGALKKPDLLIVARGGGSLEDLWAFNEEIVVRAAANSCIPLISAVGHETDTTLIDFAADKRAPTPTAAAEMAVPVRAELLAWVKEQDGRLYKAAQQRITQRSERIAGLARGLPRPEALLAQAAQGLDERTQRLALSLPRCLQRKQDALEKTNAGLNLRLLIRQLLEVEQRLTHFSQRAADLWRHRLERTGTRMEEMSQRLRLAEALRLRCMKERWEKSSLRLSPAPVQLHLERTQTVLAHLNQGAESHLRHRLQREESRLSAATRMLESLNYTQVLARGYAIVRHEEGGIVTSAARAHGSLVLTFADGEARATGNG